jgi:glycosyltransferase involved in cell wall biosynthesis
MGSGDQLTGARRITFLIRALTVGGAERQLVELAVGLQQSGWSVTVVTFYDGGALEAELMARGVPVCSLGKRGRWDILGFAIRLARTLRKLRPEVLHPYLPTEDVLGTLMKPLLPRTRLVWGVRASNMDLHKYDWLARLTFKLSCYLSRFADLIICNSEAGRAFHEKAGYRASRMVVVRNGIDVERFRPDVTAGATLRQDWGIAESALLIGAVGRLDPMKDHATFLRAAALVGRDQRSVRYVCVGDGEPQFRATLQTLATNLGLGDCLIWAGTRLDMAAVYNAVDLIVSSSSWGEGFPNAVGEAMASGVPCVVTDVGDSAWLVGDTGWVCPPDAPTLLAAAITDALSSRDDLLARGKRARLRITAQFAPARLIATTAQLLEGVTQRA